MFLSLDVKSMSTPTARPGPEERETDYTLAYAPIQQAAKRHDGASIFCSGTGETTLVSDHGSVFLLLPSI